jgi:histidyl-tRNA synthetase
MEFQWKPEVFLAYLGQAAFRRALVLARKLRHQGHGCYLDFSGGSLKSQMRLANKLGAEHVLIIGEDELARERYSIKRLQDAKQWDITFPELSAYLQSRTISLKV